ncbi:hypothetical protein [Glaciecola sp. 1036]|uniref:hypothetical protein n=1 Tax=Alteromonadaceae TaxID=72275 RepID=UPI003CFFAB5B
MSTAYFLTLDIFGDDIDFISNNKEIHKIVFAFVLLGTFLLILVKEASDVISERLTASNNRISNKLSVMATKSVLAKLTRVQNQSKYLKKNSNVFKTIADPDDQISILITEFVDLISASFHIDRDNIALTILTVEENKKPYFKEKNHRNWRRTTPKELLDNNSAAKRCIETGQPIFLCSKVEAAKNDKYFLSERDKENEDGSIYCYPVIIDLPDRLIQNIISVSTYNAKLSESYDDVKSKAILQVFNDVCRRIELELTLSKIKLWTN